MQGGGPAPVGFRRDGGGDEARPASAPDREGVRDRQTSQRVLAEPSFLTYLACLPVCLYVCPSTPYPSPSHFSSPYLSQCQAGAAIRAYTAQAHALTRTHTSRAELGCSLSSHFPRRHHLPCTTSQTHPPLAPGRQGLLSGRGVSPPISSLPPPFSQSLFLGFLGEDPKAKRTQTSSCPARLLT